MTLSEIKKAGLPRQSGAPVHPFGSAPGEISLIPANHIPLRMGILYSQQGRLSNRFCEYEHRSFPDGLTKFGFLL